MEQVDAHFPINLYIPVKISISPSPWVFLIVVVPLVPFGTKGGKSVYLSDFLGWNNKRKKWNKG